MNPVQITITIVVVVVLAFAAIIVSRELDARRRAAASSDPAALIGSGLGQLVSGIIGAAT